MKIRFTILAVILVSFFSILTNSCKKDPPKVIPVLTTAPVTNITSSTASGGGAITSDGGAAVTVRGICWSLNPNPTISDNKTSDGTGIGSFVSSITGLSPGRTYYLRAYATNSVGTAYGNQVTITTISILSTLITTEPLGISSSTATCGGNITSDGGAAVIARGVCWNKIQNPTISDSLTVNGMGIGVFTSSLTRLTPGTPYYIRAYATNSIGTAYGNQVTFNTLATIPTVITAAITEITLESASGGGTVTYDGGAAVTTRGVCWSKVQQPTITDSKTTNGTGNGSFTASITGLAFATTYYVRSYASNSAGTGYGNQISFTTLSKQAEQNIISSIGGTLTTGESVQLVIPANALPADGVVFVGRTGNEPTTVPNPDLKVVGSPITMRLPSDAILKPLQLSFPAPSGTINTDTYGVFIYNGSTYYPLEYTITSGTVNASIDKINWDITSVSTKSTWNDFYISGVSVSKTPSETGMGLKEATIESGTMKFSTPKADGSSRILLLIHGIWSDPYTWTLFLENLHLANLSYTNYWTFGYNTSYHIKENADRLDALLAQYSNGATIDIVAHSMGGLVARSEIERYKDHMYINRLVTLGTPHQGTDPAIIPYLYDYVIDNLYGGVFNMNDAGLRDLSPSSDFIINDMWALVKPPIPYYTIAARNSVEKAKFWSPSIMLAGDDDGIVSVISAKGVTGATSPSGEVVRIDVKMAHTEMPRDPQIFDQVTNYLKGKAPTVTTTPVTTYNSTSATVGGNVTAVGGSIVTETGIYWSTNILVLGTKRQIGSSTGIFSTSLTGLTPNTKYYIVAYAINSHGIGYGDQVVVTTKTLAPNSIEIYSTPTGASVYLDGTNMNTITPAILTNVNAGYHNVRLFKFGYNEYLRDIYLASGESFSINANLGNPVPPLPVFTITQPLNNSHLSSNVLTVSGSILLRSANGSTSTFTGDHAILTLNGVDQEIPVSNGVFSHKVLISTGENRLRLRANSNNGDTGISSEIIFYGDFTVSDIQIILRWNNGTDQYGTNKKDVDLHVYDSYNHHTYWMCINPSNTEEVANMIPGSILDIDNTWGFGPETFTLKNSTSTTYTVWAHFFSGYESSNPTYANIEITLKGNVTKTYGPYRFKNSYDKSPYTMYSDPDCWWNVVSFTVSGGLVNIANPAAPITITPKTNNVREESNQYKPKSYYLNLNK